MKSGFIVLTGNTFYKNLFQKYLEEKYNVYYINPVENVWNIISGFGVDTTNRSGENLENIMRLVNFFDDVYDYHFSFIENAIKSKLEEKPRMFNQKDNIFIVSDIDKDTNRRLQDTLDFFEINVSNHCSKDNETYKNGRFCFCICDTNNIDEKTKKQIDDAIKIIMIQK